MMNLDRIKLQIKETPWIKPGGYVLAYIIAMILFYTFMIDGASKKMSSERYDLVELRAVAERYKGFDAFKTDLEQQRIKIRGFYSSFEANLNSNKKAEHEYLADIGNITRKSNVNPEKLNPINANNRQDWQLSFIDTYERLLSFITQTENIFRIENISLAGSEGTNANSLNVTITAIPSILKVLESQSNSSSSKFESNKLDNSIFDMYDRTQNVINKIDVLIKESQDFAGTDRNPMQLVVKKVKAIVRPPAVTIEGIMWDPSNPLVIIEGRVLKTGDKIGGVKIIRIRESNIDVEWKEHTFTIKMDK